MFCVLSQHLITNFNEANIICLCISCCFCLGPRLCDICSVRRARRERNLTQAGQGATPCHSSGNCQSSFISKALFIHQYLSFFRYFSCIGCFHSTRFVTGQELSFISYLLLVSNFALVRNFHFIRSCNSSGSCHS